MLEFKFHAPTMKNLLKVPLLSALLGLVCAASALQAKVAIDYIDPFIGTGSQGKDFPGACTPFSMVKVSPNTVISAPTGYYYSDKTIQGFSFNQLGGADGGGELSNFLVMATTGPMKTYGGERGKPGTGYLSSFAKNTEQASAGYYAVTLADYQIRAAATVAPHSGMLRFTFPNSDQSRVQVDLSHRLDGTSLHQSIKVVDDHTIEGEIDCTRDGGGWRFGGNIAYTVYYHAELAAFHQVRRLEFHPAPGMDGHQPQSPLRQTQKHQYPLLHRLLQKSGDHPGLQGKGRATSRFLHRISFEGGRRRNGQGGTILCQHRRGARQPRRGNAGMGF